MFSDDTPKWQARFLSIRSTLSATANWRASLVQKHPDDTRNQRAAELLTALANEDSSALSPELLTAIAACPNLRDVANRVAKRVGFNVHPSSLAEFVEDILAAAVDGGVK